MAVLQKSQDTLFLAAYMALRNDALESVRAIENDPSIETDDLYRYLGNNDDTAYDGAINAFRAFTAHESFRVLMRAALADIGYDADLADQMTREANSSRLAMLDPNRAQLSAQGGVLGIYTNIDAENRDALTSFAEHEEELSVASLLGREVTPEIDPIATAAIEVPVEPAPTEDPAPGFDVGAMFGEFFAQFNGAAETVETLSNEEPRPPQVTEFDALDTYDIMAPDMGDTPPEAVPPAEIQVGDGLFDVADQQVTDLTAALEALAAAAPQDNAEIAVAAAETPIEIEEDFFNFEDLGLAVVETPPIAVANTDIAADTPAPQDVSPETVPHLPDPAIAALPPFGMIPPAAPEQATQEAGSEAPEVTIDESLLTLLASDLPADFAAPVVDGETLYGETVDVAALTPISDLGFSFEAQISAPATTAYTPVQLSALPYFQGANLSPAPTPAPVASAVELAGAGNYLQGGALAGDPSLSTNFEVSTEQPHTTYTVQANDTLWDIAREQYGLSDHGDILRAADHIALANPVLMATTTSANWIKKDDQLIMPEADSIGAEITALDWEALDAQIAAIKAGLHVEMPMANNENAPVPQQPPVILARPA